MLSPNNGKGCPGCGIWLLADSFPGRWKNYAERTPLDPRHPIVHNIWTPVLNVIQDRAFIKGMHVNGRKIFVSNAMEFRESWERSEELRDGANRYGDCLREWRPALVLTFGSRAYGFAQAARMSCGAPLHKKSAKQLGDAFRRAIKYFDPEETNIVPLLHRSISGGKWLEVGSGFTGREDGNYFQYVGEEIATILLEIPDRFAIWSDAKRS